MCYLSSYISCPKTSADGATLHFSETNCSGKITIAKIEFYNIHATREWNKLPNDCVNASSVNMFKNIIDRYLIRAGYT